MRMEQDRGRFCVLRTPAFNNPTDSVASYTLAVEGSNIFKAIVPYKPDFVNNKQERLDFTPTVLLRLSRHRTVPCLKNCPLSYPVIHQYQVVFANVLNKQFLHT